MIFLIERIDYDSMENHNPISKAPLGYCDSEEEAELAVLGLCEKLPSYDGWKLGEPDRYPKFNIVKLEKVVV